MRVRTRSAPIWTAPQLQRRCDGVSVCVDHSQTHPFAHTHTHTIYAIMRSLKCGKRVNICAFALSTHTHVMALTQFVRKCCANTFSSLAQCEPPTHRHRPHTHASLCSHDELLRVPWRAREIYMCTWDVRAHATADLVCASTRIAPNFPPVLMMGAAAAERGVARVVRQYRVADYF